MLYQEDDPEFDDGWLTDNEKLTSYIKAREQIVGKESQRSIVAICSRIPIF